MSAERTFLHALNNRLAIAYGNAKILKKRVKPEDNPQLEDLLKRLDKIITALEATTEIIQERRSVLIKQDREAS